MRATNDRIDSPGGTAAEVLARRLSEAVRGWRASKGGRAIKGATNGDARRIVIDDPHTIVSEVGSAMLAQANAGAAEHSDDVVLIVGAIGERMGVEGAEFKDLVTAARLHDIGKAWVPSELLEKPGPLTPEERQLMCEHTVVGERILKAVKGLDAVARLVRHSHERWDGRGYPDGLPGSEIPMGSRIIFCADAFHAIRCDRPYRRGRSAREALAEVKRCAGTQFDPHVAEALEEVMRDRNRRPGRGGGSGRLFALLMCLVLGAAGTALARSGALGDPGPPPAATSKPAPPPACETAACPIVAGPVGGLGAVGALYGDPGPRPLFPGLPGQLHRATAPGQLKPDGSSAEGRGHRRDQPNGKAKGHGSEHGRSGSGRASESGATHSATPSSEDGDASGSSHHSRGGHRSSGHRSGHSRGGSRSGGSRGGGGTAGSGGGGVSAPQASGGGSGGGGSTNTRSAGRE